MQKCKKTVSGLDHPKHIQVTVTSVGSFLEILITHMVDQAYWGSLKKSKCIFSWKRCLNLVLLKPFMDILASLFAPLIKACMNLEFRIFGAHCATIQRDGVLEQA